MRQKKKLPLISGLILIFIGVILAAVFNHWLWAIIVAAAGLLIWFLGGVKTPGPDLIQTGRKIIAEVKAIERSGAAGGEADGTIHLHAVGPDGKNYDSGMIWYASWDSKLFDDPKFKLWQKLQTLDLSQSKCTVPVYLDPKYPELYYMDWASVEIK